MAHAILLNIEQLVRKSQGPLKLKDLQAQYLQVYRNELNPEDFGVASIEALLLTMTDKLEVSLPYWRITYCTHRCIRLVPLHRSGYYARHERAQSSHRSTGEKHRHHSDDVPMSIVILAVETRHARSFQARRNIEHVPQ